MGKVSGFHLFNQQHNGAPLFTNSIIFCVRVTQEFQLDGLTLCLALLFDLFML